MSLTPGSHAFAASSKPVTLVCAKYTSDLFSRLRHGQNRSPNRRREGPCRFSLGAIAAVPDSCQYPYNRLASTHATDFVRPRTSGSSWPRSSVEGQTAAQPEVAVLNLVNWVSNVIAPVGAALKSDGQGSARSAKGPGPKSPGTWGTQPFLAAFFAVHWRYTTFSFLGERPEPCKHYVYLYANFLSRR